MAGHATKAERVAEILRRLEQLPPCSSFAEVRELLARTINEVEDEWTPFPYDAADLDPRSRRRATDRTYPVQDDNVNDVPGHPHVQRLTSVGEQTYIGANGAIEIRSKRRPDGGLAAVPGEGRLILARSGRDGRGVWEL